MPSEQLTATTDNVELLARGNSSGGADTYADVTEPEFIYIEGLDGEGEWQQLYRVDYEEAKGLLTAANQEAHNEQMAAIQGISADNSSFHVVSVTFLTVIVFAVFACIGCIAVQTLVKSFEVRR